MFETYPATVCGDRIIWREQPPTLTSDTETEVYVTILAHSPDIEKAARGIAVRIILERIAKPSETV